MPNRTELYFKNISPCVKIKIMFSPEGEMIKVKNQKGLVDMTKGPIFGKLILFCLPLIFTSWLNLAFNAADKVVVGRYAGSAALAAVGASSPITMFVFSLSMGLCSGVSVEAAKNFGAGKYEDLKNTIQTAISSSLVIGILLAVATYLLAMPVLELLGTPEDIITEASKYLKIYFLSIPGILCYNFGAAILRSLGDTNRPLIILTISGIINVVLNLIFVICFNLAVVGVALATAIAQYFSAAAVVIYMMRQEGTLHFDIRHPELKLDVLGRILKVGVPAGIQGVLFAISDMALQSAVNSLGSAAVAGSSAGMTVESFIFGSMSASTQGCMVFTGQNVGAKKFDRTKRILFLCMAVSVGLALVIGWSIFFLRNQLMGLMITDSPEAFEYGLQRIKIVTTCTFIYGVLDVLTASMRGFGISIAPAIISVVCICGFRILWSKTYFLTHRTLFSLYLSYPLAWLISLVPEIIMYVIMTRKVIARESTLENSVL